MMNHLPEQAANKKKAYLLGLLIGLLPILAFFLLLIDHPTELLGIFTGISVPVSLGIVQAAKIRPSHNGRAVWIGFYCNTRCRGAVLDLSAAIGTSPERHAMVIAAKAAGAVNAGVRKQTPRRRLTPQQGA